jgi:hypothetical protein
MLVALLATRDGLLATGKSNSSASLANGAAAMVLAEASRRRGGGRRLLRGRLDEDDEARANGTMLVPLQRPAYDAAGGHPRNWRRAARAAATAAPGPSDSVSAWLSAVTLQRPAPLAASAELRRVARRRSPVDGGATQVFVPTARERGDARLDTTMSCKGWRETAACSPHGPRLALAAAACDFDVTSDRSGYCECTVGGGSASSDEGFGRSTRSSTSSGGASDREPGGGLVVRAGHAACGHSPFRCRDVCRRPPRRLCRGFVAMDSCMPLAPGSAHGSAHGGTTTGWDFLAGKVSADEAGG